MGEYIERKKAIDAIVKAVDTGFAVTAEDLAGILDDLPAADVAPVVHAQWKKENTMDCSEDKLYCSECKFVICVGRGSYKARTPCCPNCWAKMDLEE